MGANPVAQILHTMDRSLLWDFDDESRFGTRMFGTPRIGPTKLYTSRLRNNSVPGEYLSAAQKGNVEITVPFRLEQPTSDEMLKQQDRLNLILEKGALFKYQPAGGTADTIRVWTFERGEYITLWDGRDNNIQFVEYAHEINYLHCVLECLPDPEALEPVDLGAPVIL